VLLQVVADYRYRRPMAVFDFGKVTPARDLCVSERCPVGRATAQRDTAQRLRSLGDGDGAAGAHSEITHQRGVILQVLELLLAQLRIPLLHLQELLRVEI